ncbi:MAG: TolC family protein [Candidatus Aadella gelida]|nr:TolC family protein [Candidatus Aadella gelida]
MRSISSKNRKKGLRVLKVCCALTLLLCVSGMTLEGKEDAIETFSLEECVTVALKNSFEVKKAKLDLYIAETDRMYSEAVFDTVLYGGASYLDDKRQQLSVFASDDNQTNSYYAGLKKTFLTGTEVSAELSDQRSWNNTEFTSKNPAHEVEGMVTLVQPLAKNGLGYIDRGNLSLTRMSIENAGLDEQDRIEGVISQVEKAYIGLVHATESLNIYKEMLKRSEELNETDKKNLEIGLTEKVDLIASEANLLRIKAEYNISENDLEKARANLKLLMNIGSEKGLEAIEGIRLKEPHVDLEGCLKEAFMRRRDYLVAKKEIEIKGLNLKIKKNNTLPEVDVSLSMAVNGLEGDLTEAVRKTTGGDNTYYLAGIEVEIPLDNRDALSQKIKAEHEKEKALITLKETERAIITEIGNAFGDMKALKESILYSDKAVELEEKKLAEEEKRFKYGRSNTKKIIDYQRDILNVKLENAVFIQKYNSAVIDLNRTMNVTLDKYKDML